MDKPETIEEQAVTVDEESVAQVNGAGTSAATQRALLAYAEEEAKISALKNAVPKQGGASPELDEDPMDISNIMALPESTTDSGLRRGANLHVTVPGAYLAGSSRHPPRRTSSIDYGLLRAGSSSNCGFTLDDGAGSGAAVPAPTTAEATATGNGNEQLAQANAIDDDADKASLSQQARPVDLDKMLRREKKMKKQKHCFIATAIFLLVLVAATVLGSVIGSQKRNEQEVVILLSTETPSVYVSVEPSEVPSFAPTAALDLLLTDLPDYTLKSLEEFGTPQWKAWEWLSLHQNITNLPEWRKKQLFALATFFFSFEGENWRVYIKERWMIDSRDECLWFSSGEGLFHAEDTSQEFAPVPERFRAKGLPCNDRGQFTSLFLMNLELSGLKPTIPPEIALLTSLSVLDLSNNGIQTSLDDLIPPELALLTDLRRFWLSRNALTGLLPTEIGLLTRLKTLNLQANKLEGSIPHKILLPSLTVLFLSENMFTGLVPTELGLLTQLTELYLSGNLLSGSFPTEFGSATSLQILNVQDNLLGGPIPSELGLLTGLDNLWTSSNSFTGSLPSDLGMLTMLRFARVDHNQLSGPFPTELGLLTRLRTFGANDNHFSGSLPTELWKLTSLAVANLHGNSLQGSLSSELGSLSLLRFLSLENNGFSGYLPNEVELLANLTSLSIGHNQFSGALPSELGVLRLLTNLELGSNNLSGSLPSELGNLVALQELDLTSLPGLTGPVPSELSLLTSLGYLNLAGSQSLSGIVPGKLCELSQDTCLYGPSFHEKNCSLTFDCSGTLCGCDCPCS